MFSLHCDAASRALFASEANPFPLSRMHLQAAGIERGYPHGLIVGAQRRCAPADSKPEPCYALCTRDCYAWSNTFPPSRSTYLWAGGIKGGIHLRLKPPAEESTTPAGRVFYVQPVDGIHRLGPTRGLGGLAGL